MCDLWQLACMCELMGGLCCGARCRCCWRCVRAVRPWRCVLDEVLGVVGWTVRCGRLEVAGWEEGLEGGGMSPC